jgi:hypothetical protein
MNLQREKKAEARMEHGRTIWWTGETSLPRRDPPQARPLPFDRWPSHQLTVHKSGLIETHNRYRSDRGRKRQLDIAPIAEKIMNPSGLSNDGAWSRPISRLP